MKPVPGLTIEQQPGMVLACMCVWAEARGETPVGRAAVLWVIRNRAARTGFSIGHIVLEPLQFSSFNANDPNREKLLSAWKDDPAGWARCDELCSLAEAGLVADPTHGATHYYNPSVAHPAWGRGSKTWDETTMIGSHVFGKTA